MIGLLVVIVLGVRPGAPEVACTNSRCVVVAPASVPRAVVERLSAERDSIEEFWTQLANDVLEHAPEHFDGDEAIDAIAIKYVRWLEEERAGLRERLGIDENCTGIAATWCPVHGDCSCPDTVTSLDDPSCPLHAPASPHAAHAVVRGIPDWSDGGWRR